MATPQSPGRTDAAPLLVQEAVAGTPPSTSHDSTEQPGSRSSDSAGSARQRRGLLSWLWSRREAAGHRLPTSDEDSELQEQRQQPPIIAVVTEAVQEESAMAGGPAAGTAAGAAAVADSAATGSTQQQQQIHQQRSQQQGQPAGGCSSSASNSGAEIEAGGSSGGGAPSMARMPSRGPPTCLICLEEFTQEEFVNGSALRLDCNCRGELALRHRDCVMKWVQVKGSNVCELCKAEIRNIPAPPPRPTEADMPTLDEAYFHDPNHIHDFMPSSQDLVFDCIRVTWVAMIVSILFFEMDLGAALWTGLLAGFAYSVMVRLMYRQHFFAMRRLAEQQAAARHDGAGAGAAAGAAAVVPAGRAAALPAPPPVAVAV